MRVNFSSLFIMSCLLLGTISMAHGNSVDDNSIKVDQLFNQPVAKGATQQVLDLANEIIPNRSAYSSNTVAKAFSLLADAATAKGEMAKALQFAQDGLSVPAIAPGLKAVLMLKVTRGYDGGEKYLQVRQTVTELLPLIERQQQLPMLLLALSYRAVANAQLSEYQSAISDLQQVSELMPRNPQASNQMELLEVLARAHHDIGNYQLALALYLKLLKLRFEHAETEDIEHIYYNIATEYRQLGKFDDAFNAYWEARKFAEQKSAPLQIAYAELGLSELLLQQQKYQQAYESLIKTEKLFRGQGMEKAYMSTLIALAKSALHIDKQLLAYQVLSQAEQLAQTTELSREQIELYRLLAEKYQYQGEYERAGQFLQLYIQANERFQRVDNLVHQVKMDALQTSEKNQQLGIKLAEQRDLQDSFNRKLQNQRRIIIVLIAVVVVLILVIFIVLLQMKNLRLNNEYLDIEKPAHYLANPHLTRQIYQRAFIQARKFQYPITVSYLSLTNWSDLSFHFRKRVVNEVAKTIATLINEHIGEFDQAGLINDGEYLILFPHRTVPEVNHILLQLTEALKTRFFANLGTFSVIISHASAAPDAQDIDPFVFLSTLTDSVIHRDHEIEDL